MDPQTPPNLPTETPEQPAPKTEGEHAPYGAIGGIVVVVVVIVLGGYYFWFTQIKNGTVGPEIEFILPSDEDQTLSGLEQQDSSDGLSSIEGDIDNTELDSIDKELSDLESEIDAEVF